MANIKKAQQGLSCRWSKGQKVCGTPLKEKLANIKGQMQVNKEERQAKKEARKTPVKGGPQGGMWHPNDPEVSPKDPSASYWQERDYNEKKDIVKKAATALKNPIKKYGGKVVKKAAVKKAKVGVKIKSKKK